MCVTRNHNVLFNRLNYHLYQTVLDVKIQHVAFRRVKFEQHIMKCNVFSPTGPIVITPMEEKALNFT